NLGISLAQGERAWVKIYSLIGTVAFESSFSAEACVGNNYQMQVGNLTRGAYILEVTTPAGTKTTRFVKQ
ncbi:MAG: T9SS type A sorting domain-containing protein, partial [Chitinophagaceae bacterium]